MSIFQSKYGSPPGTAKYTGEKKGEIVKVNFHLFSKNKKKGSLQSHQDIDIAETVNLIDNKNVNWIEIEGCHDVDIIIQLKSLFNIHDLLIEDILNPNQRPKVDDFNNQIAIFIRKPYGMPDSHELFSEQVGIILLENLVISITESPDNFFEPIKRSINRAFPLFSSMSEDFLAYSMIDLLIDKSLMINEELENKIADLEEKINERKLTGIKTDIYSLRRANIAFRKMILPLREIGIILRRLDTILMSEKVRSYLKDVNDHILSLIDSVELNRELISSLRESYSNEISNQMNEIMFTLTIISTILLPLTFLTSLYGMNFSYMPELSWRYSYFVLWGVMLAIISGLIYYFKNRRWL
ncbi:MAG: magnesium/cobalt transporter CorA [Candidatus Heimdallarchaeota archaeon]|nr:magnesium/cobalt transporter CorA [Candidatus Heimdallarchaeota archaeon]